MRWGIAWVVNEHLRLARIIRIPRKTQRSKPVSDANVSCPITENSSSPRIREECRKTKQKRFQVVGRHCDGIAFRSEKSSEGGDFVKDCSRRFL